MQINRSATCWRMRGPALPGRAPAAAQSIQGAGGCAGDLQRTHPLSCRLGFRPGEAVHGRRKLAGGALRGQLAAGHVPPRALRQRGVVPDLPGAHLPLPSVRAAERPLRSGPIGPLFTGFRPLLPRHIWLLLPRGRLQTCAR